jgi:3'-phosphoadenosine 5'-phosphosulfate sulfotransferase (PAPS reductase)/FAD synthetase
MIRVVSISGGKDSTALYIRALEHGRPFRAVFADTGNEHPFTYEAVRLLAERTGGPEVETVRADFSVQIARKRGYISTVWPTQGISDRIVERALRVLEPTGNPYLDLCIWKGRFPSARAQFCTEELKVRPIDQLVTRPLLAAGGLVISWQGVRAAESFARSLLPVRQRLVSHQDLPGRLYAFRPLLRWSIEDVWAIHAKHNVPRNPLYDLGASRVGCWPCINCRKSELALISRLSPDAVDRLEEWEAIVSEASKRGCATFFSVHDDPLFADVAGDQIDRKKHGIRSRVEYAKTSRGGLQRQLFDPAMATACDAHGACE